MKKNVFFLILTVFLFTSVSCKKQKTVTAPVLEEDRSLEDILEKGKFVIGIDDAFPPLGFYDKEGNITGYDIDLAKEVAFRMGVELVCKPIVWKEKEFELNTGNIDCLWSGFSLNDMRSDLMACTEPYLNNYYIILVNEDSEYYDLKSLSGKSVGYQLGSTAFLAFDKDPDFKKILAETIGYNDNIIAVNALTNHEIEAIVIDYLFANYLIRYEEMPLRIIDSVLSAEKIGVAFRKDNLKLRDEVQKKLDDMEVDGTVRKISVKWFGRNMSVIRK